MKKSAKLAALLATAVLAVASGNAIAQAKDIPGAKNAPAYVLDPRGNVVVDPFGLCWRTPWWTPQLAGIDGPKGAGCQCDKAAIDAALGAQVCTPPPPPPPPAPAKAAPPPPPPPAPPAPPKPVTEKVTFAADALFDFDKYVIRPDARAKLDDLVSKLAGVNLEVIVAVGHTDSIGTEAYNLALSKRRADAVKQYLVSKGIEANRIYTEGKGESQPVADNRTAEVRQKNRRVEVEIIGTRSIKR
jgi:OOP family OmpA-OmpF porin